MAIAILTGCLMVAYAVNPELVGTMWGEMTITNSGIDVMVIVGYALAVIHDMFTLVNLIKRLEEK